MAVLRGDITPDQIRFDKNRNRLVYVLGMDSGAQEELTLLEPPIDGDAYLLCSDGFWEYIYEDEMETDLLEAQNADDWLSLMLSRIMARVSDGHDNLSAIVCICKRG